METELDFWYWLAFVVSLIAAFVWAFASVITPNNAFLTWGAGAIFVLSIGSIAVRGWLQARHIV